MISSIGFIPNSTGIKQLENYTVDEKIKKKLDYLNIPILPKDEDDERQVFPEVKPTDKILFCTPNTEEISNLAFYGYDETEIFFHHDLFVFSTILDSCYVGNEALVAVATFEPTVFIYDFRLEFPVLPQYLLEGHDGPVTGIKNKEGKLISCSDDKTIIEWDLVTQEFRNRKNLQVSVEKFDFTGSTLVFGAKNYLNINNENISLDHDMEQVKCKDNNVYLSDCEGNMFVYDIRAPAKAMISKKAHSDAVLDLCLVDDWIVSTAADKFIKMWKLETDLVCKNEQEQENVVYSLGYNEFNDEKEIFAGNEMDFVYPMKLEEAL